MKNQYEIDFQQGYDKANEEWLDRMDKIRAEIKSLTDGAEPEHIWNVDVLAIIDKYKSESEGKGMNINRLMSELAALTYKSDTYPYSFDVIHREDLPRVEQVIRQFLLDNHDSEYGELKAKCYAYEKIIANSNFAPMLIKESEREE